MTDVRGSSPTGELEQRLQEIRARLEAATLGPWAWWRDPSLVEDGVYAPTHPLTEYDADGKLRDACTICRGMTGENREANAQFIASAPEDIAFLLAALAAAGPAAPVGGPWIVEPWGGDEQPGWRIFGIGHGDELRMRQESFSKAEVLAVRDALNRVSEPVERVAPDAINVTHDQVGERGAASLGGAPSEAAIAAATAQLPGEVAGNIFTALEAAYAVDAIRGSLPAPSDDEIVRVICEAYNAGRFDDDAAATKVIREWLASRVGVASLPADAPPFGVTHWWPVVAAVLNAHHPSYDVDCRENLCACGKRFRSGVEPSDIVGGEQSWENHAALQVLLALPRVPAISGVGVASRPEGPWRLEVAPKGYTVARDDFGVEVALMNMTPHPEPRDVRDLTEPEAIAVRDALNRVSGVRPEEPKP